MLVQERRNEPLILVCDSRDTFLDDDFQFEALLRLLSLQTQRRILNRKNPSLRKTALCNQLLQLFGISITTGLPFHSLSLEIATLGKPTCAAMTGLAFNMSNCDGRTAMYIDAATNVGIDLACVSDCHGFGDDYLGTFKSIFSCQEYHTLNQMAPGALRDRKFTHYWSLKEAYTKFTGTGLNCDLSKTDMGTLEAWSPADQIFTIFRDIDGKRMFFQSKWLDSNVVVSICKQASIQDDNSEQILNGITNLTVAEMAAFLHSTK
ncbi:LAFA_0E20120g1_1 [Lachancea sp. 'fantastica']|nr:LAFA_0E20120g1_1 [Lachancea sp. 'fantastica']